MSLEVNGSFVLPDQHIQEVVERKGLGHPDTLVDGLVEATEIAYAKYCREHFGVIPHHNLDKAMLVGGLCLQVFGGGPFAEPVQMLFMGRASRTFGAAEIPLEEIQQTTAQAYLARVLPHLDTSNPGVYRSTTLTSTRSTRPHWFAPRSLEDLPEYASQGPIANDTATMISYWPLTATEKLALDLEGYFYRLNEDGLPTPRFTCFGQDIKVMCVRYGQRITATLCVPQITAETPDLTCYLEREQTIARNLQDYAEALVGDRAEVTVLVNTHTKKSGPYLVTGGSSTDFGEEGAVGRGNKTHGIISSFRPNTMEAPHGKNPTYFVGKVLGYQADLIARRIYETLHARCQVVLQANTGTSLFEPARIIVSTEQPASPAEISAIVSDCLHLGRETTSRIIDEAHFLPRTNAWPQA